MTMEPNVERLEAQLKNWDAKFSRLDLKDKAAAAEAQPKIEYHKRVKHIKAKRAEAQSKFDEFRAAGIGEWDRFQVSIETAWRDIETAFQQLIK